MLFGGSTRTASPCAAAWFARTNRRTAAASFVSMPEFSAVRCVRFLAASKCGKRKERRIWLRAFLLSMAEQPGVCGHWLPDEPRFSQPIQFDSDPNTRIRNRKAKFAGAEAPDAADSCILHHPSALFGDVARALSCQAGDCANSGACRRHARSFRGQF